MAVIEVKDLVKHYGKVAAVDGVSFMVNEGEIFSIVGPNGAGKTTVVESVAGLRIPDGGSIRVLGMDPGQRPAALRRRLGVQLQQSRLPDRIKVWEILDLYSSFYENPLPWPELLERMGLGGKDTAQFRHLSGGQQQRLSTALALIGDPEVTILDELTTGLDPQARRETWKVIEDVRDRGVTVVLVTHFMEEAERLSDRMAVIDSGKVVAVDTPAGLVSRVDTGQRLRFRPSSPVDGLGLDDLVEVTAMTEENGTVTITGTGNLLHAVTSVLARHRVVAHELRADQAGLDDAYLALTGRTSDQEKGEQS